MTSAERTTAIAAYGFTPRQAAFLSTVLVHAGVCVQRQYSAFAGIAHGQVTHNFFAALVTHRFATAYPCARRGAQIYHVHHKALYRAIGEPDSRLRRPATVARAVERLMVLDAVLAQPEITWLGTEREKVAYWIDRRGFSLDELPALTFAANERQTTRYFPHKLPLGSASAGDVLTLLYLVTEVSGRACRQFLEAHRRMLHRLSRWRLLLVAPRVLAAAIPAHQLVAADFCAAPLRPAIVEEFSWFCRVRRALEDTGTRPADRDAARFARARQAFGAPRFYAAYRDWRRDGDASLQRLLSPVLHDARQRGAATVDTVVLPHVYAELGDVVQTA